ncbi:Clavaminate synthase-like protein [Aspergillus bertholletiae]|uniref:Clavaminate synthase-like protein n=1 Tax=Aspergillus bertholletiae TaxID=1226010 RepID=A0A5N7BNH8_9EURO|nr:Clavaminate synthase-like protein [Aspergillus bertholletiae]
MTSQTSLIPSISYAELVHHDNDTRYMATAQLTQALKVYGACRIRDHGIPQHIIDNCLEKCEGFFAGTAGEKATDGTHPSARFVPFASEKIRGEAHRSEAMEFQSSVYEQAGKWSEQGRQLVDALKPFHEECNRIMVHLLDGISASLNLTRSLNAIHSKHNSFFAPYHYRFEDSQDDNNPLRVPPHIDPTTMLLCYQDSYAGLEVADLSNMSRNLSTTVIQKTATFIPTNCQPGEFVLLAGHILRRLVPDMKHSVHRVKRPVGTSGFHLNYWIIPDLDTGCDFGDKKEDVTEYMTRVFPAALQNTVQV